MTHDPRTTPLTDEEISELDESLLALPDERDPLDIVMLDGFLVGVLLQPETLPSSAWLPLVYDAEGGEIELAGGASARERMSGLVMRRHDELAAHLAAREAFDPIVFELEDDDGKLLGGAAAIDALSPWAAGFMTALGAFPSLFDQFGDNERVAGALQGILRHLTPDPEASAADAARSARERAQIERDMPLADLDEAIDELVGCVMDIADVTIPRRPVERSTPKVGRNDPCPCGSGRKYKHCHADGAA
jgi:uncharacterized protein